MKNNTIQGNLRIAVEQLAASIKYTEPVNQYIEAQQSYQNDEKAHQVMEELSAYQKEIRQKQVENTVSADDLEKLRALQRAAQDNKVINTYAYAQQEAVSQLREINAEINNYLGMDFAALAKNTSC